MLPKRESNYIGNCNARGEERVLLGMSLVESDLEIAEALKRELDRQRYTIELIPSENIVSRAVLQAMGSVATNKYAEGLPGKRYYGGCEFVDVIERIACERVKQIFGCEHVNVQPHSGSQANQAVYMAALNYGDTVLGMDLSHGGHLTHGHPLNFSGRNYTIVPYGVDSETEQIDYDELEVLVRQHKPKMVLCGASAYPRSIDFQRIAQIAHDAGALAWADIAHIAGLVAAGHHQSPVPYMDFVTFTTHKTMAGPRGGVVMCRGQFAKAIDRAVFPTMQGGPLMHIIAAKAVCFKDALESRFHDYQRRVVANAQVLATELLKLGFRLVSGGTDTHLMLVDVSQRQLTGADAQAILEDAAITTNKNTIPFDRQPPMKASGIRLGTPVVTRRGMGEQEMRVIARWIAKALADRTQTAFIAARVRELCDGFPIYQEIQ